MNYDLSVIIPLYNEERIVESNVKKMIDELKKTSLRWELVLVNDGSRDRTKDILKNEFSGDKKIKIVNLKTNKGKGAAIREGVKKSGGTFIVFMDIDLATPLSYLDEMMVKLKEGYDLVIGSRRLRKSKIKRHQPFYRETLGRIFTSLTKRVLGLRVSDFTCGFKGFRKKVAKEIFSRGVIDRWVFDAEILFLANILDYKICELPVSWSDRGETRVRLWVDLPRSLYEIAKIKLSYFLGKYS